MFCRDIYLKTLQVNNIVTVIIMNGIMEAMLAISKASGPLTRKRVAITTLTVISHNFSAVEKYSNIAILTFFLDYTFS